MHVEPSYQVTAFDLSIFDVSNYCLGAVVFTFETHWTKNIYGRESKTRERTIARINPESYIRIVVVSSWLSQTYWSELQGTCPISSLWRRASTSSIADWSAGADGSQLAAETVTSDSSSFSGKMGERFA